MEASLIVIQGYLKKHSGGIFFATKKRWVTLTSDGILSLSKRTSQLPYNRININEFSDFNFEDENPSFTFCSLQDGVLVKALKFYTLENPTFEEWVNCIQRVRAAAQYNIDQTPPTPTRQVHFLKQKSLSMKALFHPDEPRDSNSDSDLAQIDPVLKVQAGGESVAKSGYIKKRGGAKGGNRAFKKRWFVVTHFGRVLYFKTSTSSTPLGQFSLIDARFDSIKENEVSIITESRIWELLFETEREKMEWMVILNRIVLDLESDGPGRAAGLTKKINIGEVGLHPRNVSLIQKSTLALGFHQADNDADEELNRINGITRRISGRNHANTMGKWEELSVACVTWNLSESLPKMSDIRFLRRLRTCHVVAIGVQECQSVIYHSFQSDQLSPIDVWLVMVKSVMGDGFTLVASRAMGAIHICVFVRHDIIDCVSNVSTTYVACGIGNVMYNKGAVAVRMNFYDTSVAFICAHLAANKEKLVERRHDYHRIASVIIENLGKTATYAKMAKELNVDDDIRESETIELDFCSTRYQQRRSTFVELNSNPLVELGHDEDIIIPEIRVKSGVNGTVTKDNKEDDRKAHSNNYVDTGDRLAREFDRCFFFGDLNYRLKAEKPWTQLLLSMSDRMLAVQEEDINLYNMQQASIGPESSTESESSTTIPLTSSLLSQAVRDSELSRKSHEVARKIDRVVDSCNSTSFRLAGKQLKSPSQSPNKISQNKTTQILPNSPHISIQSDTSLTESNPEDENTLQMLANMVPTGDYESEDEDEDGDILIEDLTVVTDVDNLCKVFDDVTNENDVMNERLSQLIQDYPLNREYSCDISVVNNPRNSEIQRVTESSTLRYLQEKKTLLFDSFHTPYPLLSSESRRGLQNFITLTGFTTRESILLRLLELDQLTEERKLGNVFLGFEEGPIRFKPSYKFDPYTDVYDTSKKSRTPSWCDRIFYNTPRYGKEVQLQTYECIHDKFHSDHHPVVAVFKIKV